MSPRANWKEFLRFSLVTFPVALYPANSDSEKSDSDQQKDGASHRYLRVGRAL